MGIPITEELKQHPLYKYFELPIKPVPEEKAKEIASFSYDNQDGLNIADINKMFDDGYTQCEFGLFGCPDGGWMFANLTDMPGVTPEMFDWWFAWHGLDTMRYAIWDKDDHYYCQSQSVEKNMDTSLSMKERYWDTYHDIKEAIADGQDPVPVKLHFVHPTEVGFDAEKLKEFKGTIVCTPAPAIMIHFMRPTATGCELRTRFYMGYEQTPDGKIVASKNGPQMPQQIKEMMAKGMLMHNVKEFTHLAEILPALYNEFKDDFTVGLK
ncbi:MAG: phloretin hydrolase [Lachnospiraceae bacterium]|nr:phloretin hydrolase [Lachnospiraceae bacterium]